MVRGKQGHGTCTDPDRNAAEGSCSLHQVSAWSPVERILGEEQWEEWRQVLDPQKVTGLEKASGKDLGPPWLQSSSVGSEQVGCVLLTESFRLSESFSLLSSSLRGNQG